MKEHLLAIAIAATFIGAPAAAYAWAPGQLIEVQAQKGRPGPNRGGGLERREPPRDMRREAPRDDRRGQMTDDERRALHQDLDKANRELYRRRFPQ